MKRILIWTLSITILAVLLIAGSITVRPAFARSASLVGSSSGEAETDIQQQEPGTGKVVVGGSYVLEEGETLTGDLLVLGGTARLLPGSTVEGGVAILGGTVQIDGRVKGDVNAIGGLVTLGSTAIVKGDVNTVSATLNRDENAQIQGNVNDMPVGPFSLVIPESFQLHNWKSVPPVTLPGNVRSPVVNLGLNPLWDGLWWVFRSFFWAALAVLVALFMPKSIERIAGTAVGSTFASGGLGCITILIIPLVLILLAITICLLPVSLIGALALWLGWILGIITLGAETGKRLSQLLKVDWALPVSAGAGTFLLTLVSNGVEMFVPCVGWLVPLLIGVVGLGAVLLTRFGSQPFQNASQVGHEESLPPLPGAENDPDVSISPNEGDQAPED